MYGWLNMKVTAYDALLVFRVSAAVVHIMEIAHIIIVTSAGAKLIMKSMANIIALTV